MIVECNIGLEYALATLVNKFKKAKKVRTSIFHVYLCISKQSLHLEMNENTNP